VPAVENSLALILNQVNQGFCTIEQVVHWMCDARRESWDVVGKGRIAVGYDADLVLVDLHKTAAIRNDEQQTKCRWSPCTAKRCKAGPSHVGTGPRGLPRRPIRRIRCGGEAVFDYTRRGYWH